MLEGKLIELLKSCLEPYVDGIDSNQLQWKNLLAGKVVLSNLHLKPSLVDFLELPYHLTFGFIGEIVIRVHISMLHISKTKLMIDVNDVVVLCTAVPECQWDAKAYREQYLTTKIATLASESLQLVVKEIQGGGFFWRSMVSFLESWEIVLSNLHIRIEDYTTNPDVSYALGCVIKKAIFHTDSEKAHVRKQDGVQDSIPLHQAFYNENGTLNSSVLSRNIDLEGVGFYIDQLDPIRLGFFNHSEESVTTKTTSRSSLVTATSVDPTTFVDALGESTLDKDDKTAKQTRHAKYISVLPTDISRRPIYVFGGVKKTLYLSKSKRGFYNGRGKVRCRRDIHDKYGLLFEGYNQQIPTHSTRILHNVIGRDNLICTNVLSHLIQYLVQDGGCAYCRGTNARWQRNQVREVIKSKRSKQHCDVIETQLRGLISRNKRLRLGVKDSKKYRNLRMVLGDKIKRRRESVSSDNLRSHASTLYDESAARVLSEASQNALTNMRRTAPGIRGESDLTITSINSNRSDMFDCDISSYSSWRILLSTFCKIVKRPYQVDDESKTGDMLLEAQMRKKQGTHKPQIITQEQNLFDSRSDSNQSGVTVKSTDFLGVCSNTHHVSDDDIVPQQEPIENPNGLSYDGFWHARAKPASAPKVVNIVTPTCEEEYVPPKEPPPKSAKSQNFAWTRYNFVIDSNENPQLKELFLLGLLEMDHNYILNPKDFKGAANFYFCGFPTVTKKKPKSSWSAWGELHNKSRLNAYNDDVYCLPKCTVFVVLDDLEITFTRQQFCCVLNFVYANALKYFNWQAGVICTFEAPRATVEDENLYMEYWPQYLLLERNGKRNQLHEFIMDFEILHSYNMIRVLRNNASEALRTLIKQFEKQTKSASFGSGECLTSAIFTNVCGQFDDINSPKQTTGQGNRIRLKNRLKLVGGIYELVTQRAQSESILNSLSKICPPHTLTVDIALDVALFNSKVVLLHNMDSFGTSDLSMMGNVLALDGLHFYFQDVYGRDGSQFTEIELLPFSILNVAFNMSAATRVLKKMDCGCRLMDGPATVLLSCGDAGKCAHKSSNELKKQWGLRRLIERTNKQSDADIEIDDMRHLLQSHRRKHQATDSVLYFSVDFSHFCTPEDADVRLLFHLNSDLFVHFCILDELKHLHRMFKYDLEHFGKFITEYVDVQRMRNYNRDTQQNVDIIQVYELIDLGVDYYNNLVKGEMHLYNLDLIVECDHQIVLMLQTGNNEFSDLYFITLDSIAVTSQVNPRKEAETSVYSHLVRLSNIQCHASSVDFAFIKRPERIIYTGFDSQLTLSEYINNINVVDEEDEDDNVVYATGVADYLTRYRNRQKFINSLKKISTLFTIGKESDVCIKLSYANEVSHDSVCLPSYALVVNMGAVYLNIRDVDVLQLFNLYMECIQLKQEFDDMVNTKHNEKEAGNTWFHHVKRDGGVADLDISTLYADENFNDLVTKKWLDLQCKANEDILTGRFNMKYEMKLDFFNFTLERSIPLEYVKQNRTHSDTNNDIEPPLVVRRNPIIEVHSEESLMSTPNVATESPTRPRMFKRFTKLISRSSHHSTKHSLPKNTPGKVEEPKPKPKPKAVASKRRLSYVDTLDAVRAMLKQTFTCIPLCSVKITGIGLRLVMGDCSVKKCRAFVGCVEIEDQGNCVPLYISCIFKGGNSISTWRWLKVKREYNMIISLLNRFGAQNSRMSTRQRMCSTSRLKPRELDLLFKHIEVDSIPYNFVIDNEYNERYPFNFRPSVVVDDFIWFQRYLDRLMDLDTTTFGQVVNLAKAHQAKTNPCFITCSIDVVDSQIRAHVHINSTVINLAWEFLDELSHYAMRMASKLQSLPWINASSTENVQATKKATKNGSSVHASIHMEKSQLNVLVDPCWFGYSNFIRYMWYKLLRNAFNMVDVTAKASINESRRSSVIESVDTLSMQAANKDVLLKTATYRGMGASDVLPTQSSVTSTIKEDYNTPTIHMDATYSGTGAKAKWDFLRCLLLDRFKRAYLIAPISLRLTGCGAMHVTFASLRNLYTQSNHTSWLSKLKGVLPCLVNFLPCAIGININGNSLCAELTRGYTGNPLTNCGIDMGILTPRSNSEFKQELFNFINFTRPHRLDEKFTGMLELSKNTIYDFSNSLGSKIIEPTRFVLDIALNLYDPLSVAVAPVPQSISITFHMEPLVVDMSVVDAMVILDLVELIKSSFNLACDYTRDITTDALLDDIYPFTLGDDGINTQHLELLGEKNKEQHETSVCDISTAIVSSSESVEYDVDEFHSCSNSTSQDEWASVSVAEDNKEPSDTRAILQGNNLTTGRLLKRLLSCVNVGVKMSVELLDINVCSFYINDVQRKVVFSLEDWNFVLWANCLGNYGDFSDTQGSCDDDAPATKQTSKYTESSLLSDIYTDLLERKVSVCTSNLLTLAAQGLLTGGADVVLFPLDPDEPLIRYESSGLLTADICHDSSTEMIMETTRIYLRGTKPKLETQIVSNVSTSWINVNVTLNLARCVFGFLNFSLELQKFRIGLLENSMSDCLEMQPANTCLLSSPITTSMIPKKMLPKDLKFVNDPQGLVFTGGLSNFENYSQLASWFLYRLGNSLFGRTKAINVHQVLIDSVSEWVKSKSAFGTNVDAAGLIQGQAAPVPNESLLNADCKMSQCATLYNNLGQPIAICSSFKMENNNSVTGTWIIIKDGDSYPLPAGPYGVLMPFVMRIKLNNCIYEIPSTLFNAAQDDETMIRLDMPKRFGREMLPRKRDIWRRSKRGAKYTSQYRFGVDVGRVACYADTGGLSSHHKGLYSRSRRHSGSASYYNLFHNTMNKFHKTRRAQRRRFGFFCKYAYVMVRSVSRLGFAAGAGAMPRQIVNLHVSSTIWISNKSQSDVVVFPSVGFDFSSRSVPKSSLVWLAQVNPETDTAPLSSKTIELLHEASQVKTKGNVLFKQIANIHESLRSIRKVPISHYLESEQAAVASEAQFNLQYIEIPASSFKSFRMAVPLSWTIEPSCTIAVALDIDFPKDIALMPPYAAFSLRGRRISSPRNLQHMNAMTSTFYGDLLFTRECAQHLYNSFEHQYIETPIPGYRGQVSLGISNYTHEYEQHSSMPEATASFLNAAASKMDAEIPPDDSEVVVPSTTVASSATNESSIPEPSLKSRSFRVTSATKAIAVYPNIRSGTGSGILIRSSGATVAISTRGVHKIDSKHWADSQDSKRKAPSVILTCTLTEVTAMSSRAMFTTSYPKENVRNYELILESCHVVENMMPYDVHIINPNMYTKLQQGSEELIDMDPCFIKSGNSAQFPTFMTRGRVIIKNLLSREFKIKPSGIDQSTIDLEFDAMSSELLKSSRLLLGDVEQQQQGNDSDTDVLPDHLIVCFETRRRPIDTVHERSGITRRYLASTQIYCTIFSENWIINWLGVPITLCKNDGRFKQVVPAQKCCLALQNLSTADLHLELKISNVRKIPNFASYPKKRKPRWYKFDNMHDADIQSTSFSTPDLTYASCMFKCSHEHPALHYLVAASMAPTPFFRTSVLEILPQVVLTNSFDFTIWISESDSHKVVGKSAKNAHLYCQKVEPQSTIEFHSQTKGDLFVQVSGIDPLLYDSIYKDKRLKSHAGSNFSIWSCPISLQPSTAVQVRYPRELIEDGDDSDGLVLVGDVSWDKFSMRPDSHRTIGYGMCEVEVQLHRGTRMVHFTASSTPDWVILNNTGMDIWVEQQGVSGFGEVCPFYSHGAADGFQNTNSKGLQFAWYDPFKDHKLVCRFYLQSNASGRLSGALGKSRTFWGFRQALGKPFMNNVRLSRALSRKSRNVKIRGALVVDLRNFQSIRTSCICNIRCGGLTLRVRLCGQTVVMHGQRTLVLTASRKKEGKIGKFGRLKSMPTADGKLVGNLIKFTPKGSPPGHALPNVGQSSKFGDKTADELVLGSDTQINGSITVSPTSGFVPGLYARRLKYSKFSFAAKSHSRKRVNLQHVIIANILGIGISLCSQLPEELVYMSFTLVRYKQKLLEYESRNTLSIGWIQFDIHDANTCYPTMLRPITNIRSFSFRRDKASKMAIRRVHRSSFKVFTLLYNTRQNKYCTLKEITNFSVEVSPLSLNLDTVIGANLLLLLDEYLSIFGYQELAAQHFANVRMGIFANVDLWLKSFDVVEYHLREIAKSQYLEYANAGPRYNISMLHVGRLVLLMNIRRSGTLVTTEYQPNSALIRYLIHFLRRAPHISDANIVMTQVTMLELCCAPYVLLTHFGSRYIAQGMQQIYKVLGAIDLLGNPKIILHHWVNGLVEAFFLMRDAARHVHFPPTAIILLLRAVLRCVVAFLSGGFDAIYRATGSLHLLFYTLSRNSDRYAVLLMSEVFKRPLGQPSNLFEGIYFAIKAYCRNFYISIGNFTLKPLYALNRFGHVLRATRCKCSEVFTSGFHIIGSIFSAVASLTFGTVSSVLSGISIAAQGFLNQLNTVPMLRAIRPRRSLQLLKVSGPMRYNYLESWSVDAVKQVDTAGDVLVTLPLHHAALYDPVSKGVAHWTILCKEADAISPLVFHMRGGMSSYFWIDRVKMGQVYNGKIAWSCDIRDVKSVQLFKVGYPTSAVQHQDSLYVKLGAKIARRYYGAENDYFLRIVYCGQDSKASTGWRRRDRIPKQIFKALQDPKTFYSDQPEYLVDSVDHDAQPQADAGIATNVISLESSSSSAIIEAYNIQRAKRLYGSANPLSKLEPVERGDGKQLLEIYRRGSIEAVPFGNTGSKASGRMSFNVPNQSANSITSAAKIIRMANLQVAKVYFSMVTSVLKEATL